MALAPPKTTTHPYRVTSGSLTRYERDAEGAGVFVKYRAGTERDVLELTAEELAQLSPATLKRLMPAPRAAKGAAKVDEAASVEAIPVTAPAVVSAPTVQLTSDPTVDDLDVSGLTVVEVRELLGGFDKASDAQAVLDAEKRSASPRSTVVAAAEAALARLK